VCIGLFGFREVRTTAGLVAGVLSVAAFALLAACSLVLSGRSAHARPTTARIAAHFGAVAPLASEGAAALTVVAAALLVVGHTSSPAWPVGSHPLREPAQTGR
jgi:hypothetical protein